MIVGAEDGLFTESRKLPGHRLATGRLPVDVAVALPEDQLAKPNILKLAGSFMAGIITIP